MSKSISLQIDKDYKSFLQEVKNKIRSTQLQAALGVNQEIIKFCWEIGKMIIEKQKVSNWGDKLIEALVLDLKQSFPDTQGFSRANLHNMKEFAHSFPDNQIVQTLSALLSVCRAWLITWSWKSSAQPDGGEGLVNHKGI